MKLPAAGPPARPGRYPPVTDRDRINARHALACSVGGGAVILLAGHKWHRGKSGEKAAKVARAFNGMIQHAEDEHRRYWNEQDQPGRERPS